MNIVRLLLVSLAFGLAALGCHAQPVSTSNRLAYPSQLWQPSSSGWITPSVDANGYQYIDCAVGCTGGGSGGTSNQGTAAAIASAWPVYLAQGGAVISSGNPLFASITSLPSITIGAAIPAGSNIIGGVSVAAGASNGASTWSAQGGTSNALLTATPVQIASGVHKLYSYICNNQGSASAYVQVFDALSASVTLGTTVPKLSEWIPAGGQVDQTLAADIGVGLTTGLTVAASTTGTGNIAPSTGIACNIVYQ